MPDPPSKFAIATRNARLPARRLGINDLRLILKISSDPIQLEKRRKVFSIFGEKVCRRIWLCILSDCA